MKKFNITVDGKTYYVEVEELKDGLEEIETKESLTHNNKEIKNTSILTESKEGLVSSPMPGTILSVKVKIGERVNKGSLLLILEAMKMENEIFSPIDGIVTSIYIEEGKSINTGDALLTIG